MELLKAYFSRGIHVKGRGARREPPRACSLLIIACMVLSFCLLCLLKTQYCHVYGKAHEPTMLHVAKEENMKTVTDGRAIEATQLEDEDEGGGSEKPVVLKEKPLCSEASSSSFTCDAEGDIRVQGSSRSVFFHPSSLTKQELLKIKPYSRNVDNSSPALLYVKEWNLTPVDAGRRAPEWCTYNHGVPAVLFSIGGFTGNLFHDFTDLLVPLFITTRQFHGEVQLLVSDSKPWWISKFHSILNQLTNYDIVEVENDEDKVVRCYPRLIIGLEFHKELGIDASKLPANCSILGFKEILRKAFDLRRETVTASSRPRLLIISRKQSRKFLNEQPMAVVAQSLGFDVTVGEPDVTTDIGEFARIVNSADVLIGAHGAGLTNMVFLPEGAVVIQVVPFGGLDWLAGLTFRDPTAEMKLKYLEYAITEEESTLSEKYPKNHPVLNDPTSVHKRGWGALRSVYLDNQDLKPDLNRLRKKILEEALKYLPHNA